MDFCVEFIKEPYLCYTEHGLHALFFSRLYSRLPPSERYLDWNGRKICRIQKEYPTASDLGKPKRQNWDVAIIDSPLKSISDNTDPYDYFTLHSVVEFGMNEAKEHLTDDAARLSHSGSNTENRYIVHLYRISDNLSGRDWSPRSARILSAKDIESMLEDPRIGEIIVYYGRVDMTNKYKSMSCVLVKDADGAISHLDIVAEHEKNMGSPTRS